MYSSTLKSQVLLLLRSSAKYKSQSLMKSSVCLCGRVYNIDERWRKEPKQTFDTFYLRSYSSHNNYMHRQRVIIEATPKIELDKLNSARTQDETSAIEKRTNDINSFSTIRSRIEPYVQLMRLDKPIGYWLLFWPGSWSIALAGTQTGAPLDVLAYNLALFFTGAVIMRSAGCTINDLWDKDIDAKVERTKNRPLVSGAISTHQAVVFLAAQLSGGLAILVQLNWYSILLGASSMALVVTYPLAKRITNYPQIYLGATFNWAALLGYSAVAGYCDWGLCLPLYAAACCWTVMYDTIYAHQDKLDDARIGIKSTALTFGANTKLALYSIGAAGSGLLTAVGAASGMGLPYYLGVGVAAGHGFRQIYTLKPDNPADCANKFRSNSWIGLIMFLSIALGGLQQYKERREDNIQQYSNVLS